MTSDKQALKKLRMCQGQPWLAQPQKHELDKHCSFTPAGNMHQLDYHHLDAQPLLMGQVGFRKAALSPPYRLFTCLVAC